MTTPAQLSAQIVDLMTRWNAQQDQMADWLTGDPAGGPNGDGRYPLTNAEGETELFLSLPAILNQVSGPAAAAASAQQAAETAAALAEAARIAAQAAQSAANDIRSTTLGYRDVVQVQRDDVAAKWSDVNFWHGQVNARQLEVATATTLSLQYRDESQQNALDALAARVSAEEARDAAYGYAISIDPAQFATAATVDARFEALIGQAPATLDTLNELAAALGDDPNFATTVANSLAGKAPLVHGHVIGDVSGLQTALDGKAALSHVHTIAQVTGLQSALDGKQAAGSYASAAHTHVIGDVSGLQTALDGKLNTGGGTITGNLLLNNPLFTDDIRVRNGHGLALSVGESSGQVPAGYYGTTEKLFVNAEGGVEINTSPDNWASGWANRRTTTITGDSLLVNGRNVLSEIDGKASLSHAHVIADVTGLQAALDGKAALAHTHTIAQVTGLQAALDGKLNLSGGTLTGALSVPSVLTVLAQGTEGGEIALQRGSGATGLGANITLDNWQDSFRIFTRDAGSVLKLFRFDFLADNIVMPSGATVWHGGNFDPSTKANTSHTHAIADVTGLQSALDGKAALSHTHAISAVTGLQSALDGKLSTASFTWANLSGKPSTFTPSAHTHTISEVTDLQSALDGKAAVNHTHTISQITDLQSTLDGKLGLTSTAAAASQLATARTINGTSFNGTANITTNSWGTSRTITIGNTGKSVNGGGNVSWSPRELVARDSAPADTYASWGDGVHLANPSYPVGTGSIVASFVLNSNRGIQLATSSFSENTPLQFRRVHTGQPNGLGAWQSLVDDTSTQSIGGTKTFTGGVTVSGNNLTVDGRNVLSDIDGKASLSHTHTIDQVTGLQSALDGKLNLSGGTVSNLTISGVLTSNGSATRDKLRVWSNGAYTIGMTNGFTFGGLVNDYAMTFQMNDQATRGFWWGDQAHTAAQGAMALTTDGRLTVAKGMRVGYGESDATVPPANGMQVSGDVAATGTLSSSNLLLQGNGTHGYVRPTNTGSILYLGAANTNVVEVSSSGMKRLSEGGYLHHGGSAYGSGRITVSTATPSGGASGDIWLKV